VGKREERNVSHCNMEEMWKDLEKLEVKVKKTKNGILGKGKQEMKECCEISRRGTANIWQ